MAQPRPYSPEAWTCDLRPRERGWKVHVCRLAAGGKAYGAQPQGKEPGMVDRGFPRRHRGGGASPRPSRSPQVSREAQSRRAPRHAPGVSELSLAPKRASEAGRATPNSPSRPPGADPPTSRLSRWKLHGVPTTPSPATLEHRAAHPKRPGGRANLPETTRLAAPRPGLSAPPSKAPSRQRRRPCSR